MGLFTSSIPPRRSQTEALVIDLRTFSCGHTRLGDIPDARDFFAHVLRTSDVCKLDHEGFEAGTKDGVLDYLFLTVGAYQGRFARQGIVVALDAATTPARIQALFGEPYWRDAKEDELVLFYEFAGGTIELQFEFPDQKALGFVTLMRNGVLADAANRRSYGVTKAWPPGTG
jgi:hypothetical protein